MGLISSIHSQLFSGWLFRQSLQQAAADSFERALVIIDGRSRVLPRDQYQIEADGELMPNMPERFAHQTFQTASPDGVSVLL